MNDSRAQSDSREPTGTGPSRPVLGLLDRALWLIDTSGAIIVTLTLGIMFVTLFANVVLRYLFGDGLTWAYELPSILFPWMVAGGVVMASARGRNIAVTVLSDMLGARPYWALMLAVHLLIGVIAVAVLITGKPILIASQFQRLSETGISQIWGYSSLVYAFGLITVTSLINVLRLLIGGTDLTGEREHASYS
jgi:TRAP-type C4-dicarboxylate transport system permease small subunit